MSRERLAVVYLHLLAHKTRFLPFTVSILYKGQLNAALPVRMEVCAYFTNNFLGLDLVEVGGLIQETPIISEFYDLCVAPEVQVTA